MILAVWDTGCSWLPDALGHWMAASHDQGHVFDHWMVHLVTKGIHSPDGASGDQGHVFGHRMVHLVTKGIRSPDSPCVDRMPLVSGCRNHLVTELNSVTGNRGHYFIRLLKHLVIGTKNYVSITGRPVIEVLIYWKSESFTVIKFWVFSNHCISIVLIWNIF